MRDKPAPDNMLPTKQDNNQSREVPMFVKSSDFNTPNQDNPFVRMESNPCGGKGK